MQVKLFAMDAKESSPEELRRITRIIRPLIARTARQIFLTFEDELLAGTIEYIVPAIWGARKEGELDDTQRAMYTHAQRMVTAAAGALRFASLDAAQRFYIQFLLRELLISKIIIWKATGHSTMGRGTCLSLSELEVAGHA
jgi:hypothetical protein